MKFLIEKLSTGFHRNPLATIDSIRRFEAESGMRLQEDYAVFLMQSNGGEGFIGKNYVSLWRLEELIEKNLGYRVADSAPELFLFGSDGGGEAFGFDRRSNEQPIVRVPFIPLDLKYVVELSPTFEGFLEALFSS